MQFGNPLSLLSTTDQLYSNSALSTTGGGPYNANATVALGVGTRTLIILVETFGPSGVTEQQLTSLSVIGAITGISYYNQPPYLYKNKAGGVNFYTIVVPIISIIDTSVVVSFTLSGNGNSFSVTVYGDTELYDESVFYNGVVQSVNTSLVAGGTSTILTGPARLLTATLENNGANNAELHINSIAIARLDFAGAMEVTFPPNTILSAGSTLQLYCGVFGNGFLVGACTFALP